MNLLYTLLPQTVPPQNCTWCIQTTHTHTHTHIHIHNRHMHTHNTHTQTYTHITDHTHTQTYTHNTHTLSHTHTCTVTLYTLYILRQTQSLPPPPLHCCIVANEGGLPLRSSGSSHPQCPINLREKWMIKCHSLHLSGSNMKTQVLGHEWQPPLPSSPSALHEIYST